MTETLRRMCAVAGCMVGTLAAAQEPAQSEGDLAMQLANPIASLISVPLQSNFEFDVGADDGFRYTLNTQPVVPLDLGLKLYLDAPDGAPDWGLRANIVLLYPR